MLGVEGNPCLVASFSAERSPPGAPQRAPDASQTRCNEHAQRLPPFTNSWGPRRAPGPARHARSRTRLRFACTGGETVTSGPVLGRRGRRRCAARTGRGGPASVSAAAAAGAEQPVSPKAGAGRRGALDGGPRGCEVCTQHAVGRAHPSLRSGHRNDVCEFVTRTRGRPAPGGLPAAWALGGGFPQRPQVPKAD